MKSLFVILFCCGIACAAQSQQLYPLKTLEDSLVFMVSFQNGRLMLQHRSSSGLFEPKRDFPVLTGIVMDEADLLLEYRTGKSADMLSHKISIRVKTPEGRIVEPREHELSYQEPVPGIRRLIWLDASELLNEFGMEYTLYIRRSLMGMVDCDGARPGFTLQKQLPYYGAATGGVVLLGLGQIYRIQKEDYYDTYSRLWREGEPMPPAGDNPLQKARDKEKIARICTWTGTGLLLADALLYTIRLRKIKKRQKVYDEFCRPKTSFRLIPANAAPGIGFSLSF
jgi:hypothetical protein